MTTSLLSQALEDSASPDPTTQAQILMTGPLASVYSKALQQAFPQGIQNEEGVASVTQNQEPANNSELTLVMESQAMDHVLMGKMAQLVGSNPGSNDQPATVVYGVSRSDVDEQVVVDVSTQLASKPADSEPFVLIVDHTMPGTTGTGTVIDPVRVEKLEAAMEALVECYGGKTFKSFKAFAESL